MTRSHARISVRTQGFTLLELLLVLGILALTTAILIPSFSSNKTLEIQASVRDLVSGLRYARNQAVARQKTTEFMIDVDTGGFEVSATDYKRQLPADVKISLYTVRSELNDGHTGIVIFFPDGTSTGGRITVVIPEGQAMSIDIDWLTGRVHILEVNSGYRETAA